MEISSSVLLNTANENYLSRILLFVLRHIEKVRI